MSGATRDDQRRPDPDRPAPPEFSSGEQRDDLGPALRALLRGAALTAGQTTAAFEAMMGGRVHHGEMGALLALLATRTPAAEEILGAARAMRAHVQRVESRLDPARIVDTAGTGGAFKTFNASTAAALIAAGAGATVAKHGNRSRTGRGSAEVLRALGVNVDAAPAVQARCLEEAGVSFSFAIHHHPATRHVMPVRQALPFPTIFNLLGPLANPAGARRQLMGVYERRFLRPIAEALLALGAVRALVVHSRDGLDELAVTAPTDVMHVRAGRLDEETVDPAILGLAGARLEDLAARDLDHAATLLRSILDGTERGGPRRMAVLNAAGALQAADLARTWPEGIAAAERSIDGGAAALRLRRLVEVSNSG
jgi:anthranilate phosphoribosyltransferase